MRPLPALVLVLALLGVLVGAFLVLRDDGGRGRIAAPTAVPPSAISTEAASLDAPDGKPGVDVRTKAPATSASALAPAADATRVAKGAASSIAGRVVDELGRPLAGVSIRAAPDSPWARRALERGTANRVVFAKISEGESDAEGRFRIELASAARAVLALDAPARVSFVEAFALRAGEEVDVGDLALAPGVILAGRVVDRAGRPVEGAQLSKQDSDELGFDFDIDTPEALAVSDAGGRFRIDRLAPGPWRLRIEHETHPDRIERGETRRAGERVEDLVFELEDGVSTRGRVLDATAEALAEMEVHASLAASLDEPRADPAEARTNRRTRPDADGRFVVLGLRAGESYRLQGRAASRGERGFPGRSLTPGVVAEAGSDGIELRVRPTTSIVFQVVDAVSGEPLEGFEAWAGSPFPMPLRAPGGRRLSEHPEGRARFDELSLMQGDVLTLRVEALGFATFERKDVRVLSGRENDLGIIRLARVPILTVRVLDELSGAPIEGARVRVQHEENGHESGHFEGAFDFDGDLEHDPLAGGAASRGRTDEEGLARLTSLPGERVTLDVRAKGYAPRVSEPLELPLGSDHEALVRLGPGGSVLVRVVDPEGAPVAGVGVEHKGPDGRADGFSSGGPRVTDAAGELAFDELAAGPHSFRIGDGSGGMISFSRGGAEVNVIRRISGETESQGPDWSEVLVLPRETRELRLVSEPRTAVTGRVLEAGAALVGATLRLSKPSQGDDLGGFPGMGGGPEEARTDHEGRFHIDDVEVGDWKLVVRHPERAMPYEIEVRVDERGADVLVELPVVGIRGEVRDEEGEPLAGVRVQASKAEGGTRTMRRMVMITDGGDVSGDIFEGDPSLRPVLTDEDGRYELRGLVPDVELVVKASGSGLQPVQSERVRLGPGEIREGVDLEMQPGGALPVEVVGANGEPSLGMIEARWAGEEKGIDPKTAFAGPSGKTRLDGMRPGRWTISMRPLSIGGGGLAEPVVREVEVKVGENDPVRITLP